MLQFVRNSRIFVIRIIPQIVPLMQKIAFYLCRPVGVSVSIIVKYRCSDGYVKHYTGIRVAPDKWDPVNQVSSVQSVNTSLGRISSKIRAYVESCDASGRLVTKAGLESVLKAPAALTGRADIFERYEAMIAGMKDGSILTHRKRKYGLSSILTTISVIRSLKKFQKKIYPEEVTQSLYDRFVLWGQEMGYTNNYIGQMINVLMAICARVGIQPPKGFRKISERVNFITLTEEELDTFRAADLKGRLDDIRDWFIIGCYTCLRKSDLFKLKPENFEHGYMTVTNKKTGAIVITPVSPKVKAILDKRGGKLPGYIGNMARCPLLREAARKAGIKTRVVITKTIGGKRMDFFMDKCDAMVFHTSRRTIITNLLKNNTNYSLVMKLAGISTVRTILTYDKMSPLDAAQAAASLPYFS